MKRFLITVIAFSMVSIMETEAQECNCENDFRFIAEKVENEHPGFKKTIKQKGQDHYDTLKEKTIQGFRETKTKADCVKLLNTYLSFIKDKHMKVYVPKEETQEAYEQRKRTQNQPTIKILDDNTTYVRVPSFNYTLWKDLDNFYDSITTIVKSRGKMILDIRNNGGGGVRMYKQLLQIIKKGNQPNKVVVLFNRGCASACEEVALKVSRMKKVTTMGLNTNGQFAYGFIKGYNTPSCNLKFIITTRRYPKRMKYEYIGVEPDILLDKSDDWIMKAHDFLINLQ